MSDKPKSSIGACADLIAAQHEYKAAQELFNLAVARHDQAGISRAARLVSTALDQLGRAKQQQAEVQTA